MNLQEAIGILEVYHDWRLSRNDDYVYEPQELTEAIEAVLAQVKKSIRLKSHAEIANTIKDIRMSKSYTQAWVAKQMGLSQGEYSKIENIKRKKLSIETLNTIAEILDVPTKYFIQ